MRKYPALATQMGEPTTQHFVTSTCLWLNVQRAKLRGNPNCNF